MHGDVLLHLLPFEFVNEVVGDELRWLVEGKSKLWAFELLLDLRQAWRRVDDDRILATVGRLQQCLFEVITLSQRLILETTRVEDHTAALRVETFGVDDFILRLVQNAHHGVSHATVGFFTLDRTHHTRHTRRQVNHLAGNTLGRSSVGACRERRRELGRARRHVRVPHRNHVARGAVQHLGNTLQHTFTEDTMRHGNGVQQRRHHAGNGTKVTRDSTGERLGVAS
mmetsp:Transcript_5022/g.10950  ORF Transcript_5022/g.10950 Transcript_5022/m.10950 type:complete len:226 (-) Transcript_5022:1773-2450(-)